MVMVSFPAPKALGSSPQLVFRSLLASLFVLSWVPFPLRPLSVTHPSLQLTVMFCCWRLLLQMMRTATGAWTGSGWQIVLPWAILPNRQKMGPWACAWAASLPLPSFVPSFDILGSQCQGPGLHTHVLTGTWLAGRSQEARLTRKAGKKRNVISSFGVHLPFESRCFHWIPTLCQAY